MWLSRLKINSRAKVQAHYLEVFQTARGQIQVFGEAILHMAQSLNRNMVKRAPTGQGRTIWLNTHQHLNRVVSLILNLLGLVTLFVLSDRAEDILPINVRIEE